MHANRLYRRALTFSGTGANQSHEDKDRPEFFEERQQSTLGQGPSVHVALIKQSDMPAKRTPPKRRNELMQQQNQNKRVNLTKCRACQRFRRYYKCFSSRFSLGDRSAFCACAVRVPVRAPVPCVPLRQRIPRVLVGTPRKHHRVTCTQGPPRPGCYNAKCSSDFLVCPTIVEGSNSSSFSHILTNTRLRIDRTKLNTLAITGLQGTFVGSCAKAIATVIFRVLMHLDAETRDFHTKAHQRQ